MQQNEQIKFPSMRVVFKDPVTGASAWKIMERKEALEFAKSQSLDLILGGSCRSVNTLYPPSPLSLSHTT